jgi:hypothetical protein
MYRLLAVYRVGKAFFQVNEKRNNSNQMNQSGSLSFLDIGLDVLKSCERKFLFQSKYFFFSFPGDYLLHYLWKGGHNMHQSSGDYGAALAFIYISIAHLQDGQI